MKKIVIFLAFFVPMFFISIPVQAKENPTVMITSGYTSDGIYYEVHGEIPAIVQYSGEGISVSRTVTYSGKVTPQDVIVWRESINGVSYTGTLRLSQRKYDSAENKTTATYRGMLKPEQ